MSNPKTYTYSPPWAPHVTGTYPERTYDEDGTPEDQKIKANCSLCGAEWIRHCSTGLARERIQFFASQHLHRDPLSPFKRSNETDEEKQKGA